MEEKNGKLDKQVKVILNKIEVNNLLKEIDIEELKLIAKNNKEMNTSLEKMMIKLNSNNSVIIWVTYFLKCNSYLSTHKIVIILSKYLNF